MKKTNEGLLTRIRNVVAKDGGFTLIEVLAVMVIVGLLAAIAIPQISKWREKAHVTALKTDARSLSQAIEAYYVDNADTGYPADLDALEAAGLDADLNAQTTIEEYEVIDSGEAFQFELSHSKTSKVVSYVSNDGGLKNGALPTTP